MTAFTMPALGADMEAGKVVQWLVQPGARVRPGDVVAVVETHKGAIDVECFLDGVIGALAPLDTELRVGAVLAEVQPLSAPAAAPAPAPSVAPAPAPAPVALTPAAPPAGPAAPPAAPPAAVPRAADRTRTRVSPAARRLAAAHGLCPDTLPGSGADGAVVLADVQAAVHGGGAPRPGEPPATPAAVADAPRAARGFDPALMRQAIAAAMARSKREIPHYYLQATVDFGAAQAWLDAWNAAHDPAERVLPAALLLKTAALALAEVPQLNGFWQDGGFSPGAGIHVGWAIALRGGGLVAPAVRHADRLPLPALMAALRDLVQRARSGGLRSSELTDPTVTVTSLGERGAESVLGVIYPPQVALLGFGRVVLRPWMVDGRIEPRPVLALSLAADHRASDGHLGGKLLAAVDRWLQAPERL